MGRIFPSLKAEQLPDGDAVEGVASLLEVGPFDVFMLAFDFWYGERPQEREVEPAFVRYLYGRGAPVYVRHFARLIAVKAERGRLDRAEFGLPPRAPEPHVGPVVAGLLGELARRGRPALYAASFLALFFVMPVIAGH